MEKKIERKFVAGFILLLLLTASFVNFNGYMPRPYIVSAGNSWEDCSDNSSAWHNSTYLNVTIESKYPRILWYDVQKYTGAKTVNDTQLPASTSDDDWVSIRNNMTEVDNATWLRFVINVSSDQGWDNIEYINISGWHDNGTDSDDGTGYNTSGNHGSNRNFFLYYDNTSNDTAYYNISWPSNRTELTKGNFTESVVTDALGLTSTRTHNLTFQFKPGYQFRYAPGPDGTGNTWTNYTVENTNGYPSSSGSGILDYETTCWEALNNTWSWNFNITVVNYGESGAGGQYSDAPFKSWVNDEFGVYSYTEIVSAGSAAIQGAPGANYSTNSSNPFNSGGSQNVSVRTRSNGNYSLVMHISDLLHDAADGLGYDLDDAPSHLILDNNTIWVRGGTRTTRVNFSDTGLGRYWISLYGTCNETTGNPLTNETHEVNGTCKYTGEAGDDGLDELYPNYFASGTYGSQNDQSHYIEFTCDIPLGQWAGKYSTHVYYHLRTHTI
jgi:hypothetical protein